jgi:pyruvate,orthophosphate dikinase
MIPLVGHVEELRRQKKIVLEAADEVLGKTARASSTSRHHDRGAARGAHRRRDREGGRFFSFGTNDLTQMGFGLSRDDAGQLPAPLHRARASGEGPVRVARRARRRPAGEIGVQKGRAAPQGLKIGVCGEHGGDPRRSASSTSVGLDYVSCSPYRVPIARLAAAQAQLDEAGRRLVRTVRSTSGMLTYFRSVNGKIEQLGVPPSR